MRCGEESQRSTERNEQLARGEKEGRQRRGKNTLRSLTELVIVPVSDLVKRQSGPLPYGRLYQGSSMTVRSEYRRASDGVHAGENGCWSGELELR